MDSRQIHWLGLLAAMMKPGSSLLISVEVLSARYVSTVIIFNHRVHYCPHFAADWK